MNWTTAEFETLKEIQGAGSHGIGPPLISPVSAQLVDFGYAMRNSAGRLAITERGNRVLFDRQCVLSLRSLHDDPGTEMSPDIAAWLKGAGCIASRRPGMPVMPGRYQLTDHGHEWLLLLSSQGGEPKKSHDPPVN